MFRHYLIVAFRNLWKYKLQSAISIVGLSVGFVCFTLAILWIRYELTYDNFHKDADNIYRVRTKDTWKGVGLASLTPYPLAGYLKETFPEIKDACSLRNYGTDININEQLINVQMLMSDSSFFRMFNIPVLSGNISSLQSKDNKIAITEELAARLFGKENPVGKEIDFRSNKATIEGVIPYLGKHTNIPFDVIQTDNTDYEFNISACETYILLNKGVNTEQFIDKLYNHKITKDGYTLSEMVLTPITALHYTYPDQDSNVRFNHVLLFALAGGLVILCSLFNYLTLLVSRIRMRGKELALRKVNGASGKSFLTLLSTELIITLFFSVLLGMLIMEWVLPRFKDLSGIQSTSTSIYAEVIGYALLVTSFALLFSLLPIEYFRRKTLHASIQGGYTGKNRNLFRRGSLVFQLIISIGFIFCTSTLFKQVYYLNQVDMGIERKNICALQSYTENETVAVLQEIKRLPSVIEAINVQRALLPGGFSMAQHMTKWEDKHSNSPEFSLQIVTGDEEYIRFYGFKLIQGKLPDEKDKAVSGVIINETACKKFGWENPIGKKFDSGLYKSKERTIVGVIKDFYIDSPTIPAQAVAIINDEWEEQKGHIIYKYRNDNKAQSDEQIRTMLKNKFPSIEFRTAGMQEEYDKYMQSEQSLLILLGFVSIVCVIVSIFGIYSLASLTAEEKRKEIAVRKVSGATVGGIIQLFLREYLTLLIIASVIAFPIGYLIMKPWLESYIKQTEINTWLYIAIFILTGLVIISNVISCVWNAARSNPAEVIKSE